MRFIEVKHKLTKKVQPYRSIKIALNDLNEYNLRHKVYHRLSKGKSFENENYLITRKTIK